MSRVTVIGAGLVGLATAYKLLRRNSTLDVVVLEKENRVGAHQSGHNSGVLHCGLHYRPGSLKARLAVAGIREMIAFCRDHGLAHEQCGKLVVATEPSEIERLDELERRGRANGLSGLRRLSQSEVIAREPHVRGVTGLLVPEEGLADFPAVARHLAVLVEDLGGRIQLNQNVIGLHRRSNQWTIATTAMDFDSDYVIGCAGLFADRLAKMAGHRPKLAIVPFRGEYYRLKSSKEHLVRHMIYPVPDPGFPFLGVHLHRRVAGGVEGGPTAVLAAAREGYRFFDFNARDFLEAVSSAGVWRFALRYPKMCADQLVLSARRASFARALRRLVPSIAATDLEPSSSGVRAQGIWPNGRLVEDFVFTESEGALHVLNAPSPAATASLAIGSVVADRVAAMV